MRRLFDVEVLRIRRGSLALCPRSGSPVRELCTLVQSCVANGMKLRTAFEPQAFVDFWTLSLGQFLVFVGFFAFFQFPLYIKDLGGGEKEVGLIMGVISLASALLIPWITGIVERTERVHVSRVVGERGQPIGRTRRVFVRAVL